ncbi:hypothetical protein MLD38_032900 [Melastoma candidum]|uniref:Uncharacterized protein n=1 Tax=Melastoma candidum TaxID=119954 RepID=A0ACB9M7A9_9MYRT|nr:hypothetical protein MLD38_032900 [Melastoma candidum]
MALRCLRSPADFSGVVGGSDGGVISSSRARLDSRFGLRSFSAVKTAEAHQWRLDEVCLLRYQQYSLNSVPVMDYPRAGTPISDKSVVEILVEVPKYSWVQVGSCTLNSWV